jgi:hypothetical protein
MPEFALHIDQAGVDLLTVQEYDDVLDRFYYLLGDNPAVRVTVREGQIEDCAGRTLAVIAGVEECWGQWQANAHLEGRKTYAVTIFAADARDAAPELETLSAWLHRNYLADGAPYREPGGRCYRTPVHPARNDRRKQ